MKMKIALVVAAVAVLVAPAAALATGSAPASRAHATRAQDVNWQIPLVGSHAYPSATGSSQYQSQPGQSEFQAEVEHVRSLAGRQLLVKVNGVTVGKMRVSMLGQADLTLNSELGQSVPTINVGSKVTVTTGTGTLVASGSY
jgi:hypothetical protein